MFWIGWLLGGIFAAMIGATAAVAMVRRGDRRREERVRLAERRAADSERLAELGSMTGGLAHEIKNPLSSVVLNAQLVEEAIRDLDAPEDETAPMLRRVAAMVREAERLRTILTDFLQFAGRMKLDLQPVDLRTVVEDVVDFFHPQADASEVVLRSDLPAVPAPVLLDASLFKQALLNLMINALHATEANAPGTPKELLVRVAVTDEEISVHVIDSGPGVPADLRERIFHPYVSGTKGGSGLGLPTARRIVEEHGGRIALDVLEGRGSDFSIVLPAARSTAPNAPAD